MRIRRNLRIKLSFLLDFRFLPSQGVLIVKCYRFVQTIPFRYRKHVVHENTPQIYRISMWCTKEILSVQVTSPCSLIPSADPSTSQSCGRQHRTKVNTTLHTPKLMFSRPTIPVKNCKVRLYIVQMGCDQLDLNSRFWLQQELSSSFQAPDLIYIVSSESLNGASDRSQKANTVLDSLYIKTPTTTMWFNQPFLSKCTVQLNIVLHSPAYLKLGFSTTRFRPPSSIIRPETKSTALERTSQ